MRYKHFKNADVDVSALAVGTWAIGGAGYGEVNDKDSIDAIHAMFDGGVNLIDTAPGYGDGYSEQIVGKALKGYDRSKILVSTKTGVGRQTLKYARSGGGNGPGRDGRFENILYQCECSLRRLDTDYIDFLFVHWPDYETPFSETMEAMNTLKKEGKIRYVGLSNFNEEQIMECEKVTKIDVIQPPYSMVVRRDEKLMKWCIARGIDTFTYGSLGSGLLTGAIRENPVFGKGDPRGSFYSKLYTPENFNKTMQLLSVMDRIAAEHGKPVVQVAINWSCQHPLVGTILVGVKNEQEALENCAALEWKLSDEEIALLNKTLEDLQLG